VTSGERNGMGSAAAGRLRVSRESLPGLPRSPAFTRRDAVPFNPGDPEIRISGETLNPTPSN
jgi:hypothetical protein